ncbi:hypothetical protein Lal_00023095 [Lupinus albus]|uniref:DUF7086 domain-containing protein n=1 Tax=Lupinus albus TaxID=3870 RepID=A0A6A5NC61_LUPAL|nr:hypothetical protein Lalb_Chr20g0113141 [Lupinus albus]KAF1881063.1 hypothetical protein Lal_00023095 [Lupinus albus]
MIIGDSPSFEENHDSWLNLELSLSLPQPQLQHGAPQPQYYAPLYPLMPLPPKEEDDEDQETGPSKAIRQRKQPVLAMKKGKSVTITQPFQWATSTRATVHSLEHLLSKNIVSITGTVQCNGCKEQFEIEFDLKEKFEEVAVFIRENRYVMHDRAPKAWTNPLLPTCNRCGQENSLKPVISPKKRTINWLFLLLGQMIGCCNLKHLKYFCKHTKCHRTGAKDRLIYLTYMVLYKQLKPDDQ